MRQDQEQVFRKSFVAYLRLMIRYGVVIAIALAVAAAVKSDGGKSFANLVAFVAIVRGLYRLVYIRTVRITVRPYDVRIRAGVLPWKKWDQAIPYNTVFEAYYTKKFFGHFLNYGTIVLRRSEGVTSARWLTHIHEAKRLQGLINQRVNETRDRMVPPPPSPAAPAPVTLLPPPAPPGDVGQLSELSRLRAQGDITEDEFARMKARIIGT